MKNNNNKKKWKIVSNKLRKLIKRKRLTEKNNHLMNATGLSFKMDLVLKNPAAII